MDDETNRPHLKAVDRLKAKITTICDTKLYPGANQVVEAATEIAAETFLMYLEGSKPEVTRDFWMEVSLKRGKRPITKLVNYVIDETPPHLRRIIQEMQNEIASTVEILVRDWKPVRFPTDTEVLTEIERRGIDSKGTKKGISELHRLWMAHLSSLSVQKRQEERDLLDIGKRAKRQEVAAEKGVTVEELAAEEERQRVDQEQRETQARLEEYITNGTVVLPAPAGEDGAPSRPKVECFGSESGPEDVGSQSKDDLPGDDNSSVTNQFDWLTTGAIYVEHAGSLVRLSEADCERVRACMTKH